MQTRTAALLGTCTVLAACGGSDSTRTAEREATRQGEVVDTLPPQNTEVGPVCAGCLSAGGESSDFDGGQDPCVSFIRRVAVSDAELENAGFDVATYRSRLKRPFEASLRWTDLTTSSASPRSTPVTGYAPETLVRGSVTTGGIERTFFDLSTCTDAGCPFNGHILDCSYYPDRFPFYRMAVDVTLATDDGAVDTVFHAGALLENPSPDLVLRVDGRADLADVQGTLRIEPLPTAPIGALDVLLAYSADSVRGQLELTFTNDWIRQVGTGTNLEPVEDRPLVANFPADDCEADVTPAPLDEPDPLLSGRIPSAEIAELGSIIAASDTAASWTHTGQQTALHVELDAPEYACLAPGRIRNVPLRLSTADGMLDWSVLAVHDLADESASLPHRLWFYQELTPLSKMWNEIFGAFQLASDTERIFVRFRGEYPARNADGALSGAPGHAVLEISESSVCKSQVSACHQEQSACLVAPAGAECFIERTF